MDKGFTSGFDPVDEVAVRATGKGRLRGEIGPKHRRLIGWGWEATIDECLK